MNKNEFRIHLIENYNFDTCIELQFLNNVLDYAEGMEEIEQYDFLCAIIPGVAEVDIKKACY